jgi:chemotaxis signal transduction protein
LSSLELDPSARVEELRRSFNERFAVPRQVASAVTEDLLMVRLAGRRYGIRVAELRGLHEGRKITPLPSTSSALLGLAGIRGDLVPAYSLAALLACGNEHHNERRWLAICGGAATTIALAFTGYEGSVRILESDLHPADGSLGLPVHTCQIARCDSEICYVISTRSILDSLTLRTERDVAVAAESDGSEADAHATRR